MAQVIDELVTILGFEMDSQSSAVIGKFNKGIESVAGYAKSASMAIVAASASIAHFVGQANKASGEIEKLGRVTGISTDTIQEMSFAMEQVGGDSAAMNSDLVSLMTSMNSPIPGEFNQGLFLLGISTEKASGGLKDVDEVLLEIADKMQGMSKQNQMQWGAKIGISKDTIMLLQEGRGEIERLRKQATQIPTIIDPESLKNAQEFNKQLSLIGRVLGFVGQTAASVAGPAIKDMVDGFVEWVKVNRELIQSGLDAFVQGVIKGFKEFAKTASTVVDFVSDLIPELDGLTGALTGTQVVSTLVYSALIALAIPLAIIMAKFLLVAAAVAAVGLVIEDFVIYLEGGESVIGEFIETIVGLWEVFSQKFPAMAEFIEKFIGVLGSLGSFLKDVFFVVMDKFIGMSKMIGKGWSMIAGLAESALEKLGFGDKEAKVKIAQEVVEETVKPAQAPIKAVQKKIKEVAEPIQAPIRAVQSTIKEVAEPIQNTIKEVIEPMQGPIEAVQSTIKEVIEPIQAPIRAVQSIVKEVAEPIQAPIEAVQETIGRVRDPDEAVQDDASAAMGGFIQMVTKSVDSAKIESGKLNPEAMAVSSSVAPVKQMDNQSIPSNVTNNVDITITGSNAPAVASEVSSKLKTTLYQLYPGGLAPAVQ